MKLSLIVTIFLALNSTACACFEAYKLRTPDTGSHTYHTGRLYSQVREAEEKNAEQWKKWNKTTVSDDVIIINLDLTTGQGQAR